MDNRYSKLEKLKEILKNMGSVLVAYSGGVDSTFLAKMSKDILGDNHLAVIAKSETYSAYEIDYAIKVADGLHLKYIVIETRELYDDNFSKNPVNRCYYCKKELFSKLNEIAKERNIKCVVDGTNYDDLSDRRPGRIAAGELNVRSPLKESFFTKDDIRYFSKEMGLPTYDKPSYACLASRFPYDTGITREELIKVEEGEKFLMDLGLKQVRIRHYGNTVRIEVGKEDIAMVFTDGVRDKILDKLGKLGYIYITLDLKGYRTGSMNEVIKQ